MKAVAIDTKKLLVGAITLVAALLVALCAAQPAWADDESANQLDEALCEVEITQIPNTTKVSVNVPHLEELKESEATHLVIEGNVTYAGDVKREAYLRGELSSNFEPGRTDLEMDLGDFAKWNLVIKFVRGDVTLYSKTQTLGLVADQYNLVLESSTMPVTLFTLQYWKLSQGVDSAGEPMTIPSIVFLNRTTQYDWDELPEGMYALPYFSALCNPPEYNPEGGFLSTGNLDVYAEYVKDLYEMNPNSKFNIYLNDYYLGNFLTIITANKIPDSNITVTIMSDGDFSYKTFNESYAGTDCAAVNAQMIEEWEAAENYFWNHGRPPFGDDFYNEHPNKYSYALFCSLKDREVPVSYWVTRKGLFVAGDADFQSEAQEENLTQINIATELNNLTADQRAEFKALYNFSDGYFADAEAAGKDVMLFLGTRVPGEVDFEEYAKYVMSVYGDNFMYYYKGHPGTPTAAYPEKQAQLDRLGVTDVNSSIAAELIVFFYPDIHMSGYQSSTYQSVPPAMAAVMFNKKKSEADSQYLAIMDEFMSRLDDTSGYPSLATDSSHTYFLTEYSDDVIAENGFEFGIWDSNDQVLTRCANLSTEGQWNRLAGATRYETMAKIVQAGYDSSDTVLIASGQNFPDALAANGLAGINDAPVVLTSNLEPSGGLTADARQEVERLRATEAIIIGGTSAVSEGVQTELEEMGLTVTRVAGDDRCQTAIEIFNASTDWSRTAIVATSSNYPDALSISPYAFANKSPIFLTDAEGNLTPADEEMLTSENFDSVIILGGTSVVSEDVDLQLQAQGLSTTRLAGVNRYETSDAIAVFSADSTNFDDPAKVLGFSHVTMATGENFPDAIAAGSLCGSQGNVLLLAANTPVGRSAVNNSLYNNKDAIELGMILGGTAAFPDGLTYFKTFY